MDQKKATLIVVAGLITIMTISFVRSTVLSEAPRAPITTEHSELFPTLSDEQSIPSRFPDLVIPSVDETPGDHSENLIIRKGKEHMHDGEFGLARDTFTKIAATETIAEYYLGLIAAYFGERDAARTHLDTVIARSDEPALSATAQNILDTYVLFDTYRDGPPEFLDTLISRDLLAAQETELAIGKLQFVTLHNRGYTDAWILLGTAYLVSNDFESALNSFRSGLPSEKPESYYWLGVAYLYQDNAQKSLAAFKQAQKKGYPEGFKIHEKMGDAYVLLRQYHSAVQSYEKALALEPGYADLYVRPVWIYIELLNEPEKAFDLAVQARDRFPSNALSHNLTGWAYLALEEFTQAKISLDRAQRIDPKMAAVYFNIGQYYEAINNPEKALENLQEAVNLDPEGSIGRRAEDEYNRIVEQAAQEPSEL